MLVIYAMRVIVDVLFGPTVYYYYYDSFNFNLYIHTYTYIYIPERKCSHHIIKVHYIMYFY